MRPGDFLGKGMELRKTERIYLDESPDRMDVTRYLPVFPSYSLASRWSSEGE
jgi:hypothetical protein